ncbi:MAG: alpha-L-fucosidase [Clostridia bacterium]|nr:alpha-L-fucosidase [Clostridia bacterium]
MAEDLDMFNEDYNHSYSEAKNYVEPTDPLVKEKLEWFQDQKLGFMMHWGPYSEWGFIESWALPDEDTSWVKFDYGPFASREEFKKAYVDLNKTFNPVWFEPDKWAQIAERNCFKYLLFTTKHHDGFCMWDTAYSDYKITAPDCPFHTNKNADVCKNLFEAFRNHGMGIAAYFSKADWHTPYYWAPGMEHSAWTSRNPTYDTEKYPWLWEQFVQFTENQILELMTKYGKIDSLWLDAGQVRPDNPRCKQDIRLSEIVAKARKYQPGLLVADRTVGGENENYVTPEQTVPAKPLGIPWESCVTLGGSFAFNYDDEYRSPRALVRLLADIVAKGGNLALNIAPRPDGKLPTKGVKALDGLGTWLRKNGDAIFNTRVCVPYRTGKYAYTQNLKTSTYYAIYLADENEKPEEFEIPFNKRVARITFNGEDVPFKHENNRISFTVSPNYPEEEAYVFTMKGE